LLSKEDINESPNFESRSLEKNNPVEVETVEYMETNNRINTNINKFRASHPKLDKYSDEQIIKILETKYTENGHKLNIWTCCHCEAFFAEAISLGDVPYFRRLLRFTSLRSRGGSIMRYFFQLVFFNKLG